MNIIIKDTDEHITCRECGKTLKILNNHIKTHGFTSESYWLKYPGAPIIAPEMIKRCTKNSGQHMKQDKYREMAAAQIRGENNPNHKSKTTLEQRQKISPFSREFYRHRNPELTEEELTGKVLEFAKEATKDIIHTTSIEYYLNKGLSQEEAERALKTRQSTFTLEKCIEKWGPEEGIKKFNERQEKWLNSIWKNAKYGYSHISQELFKAIEEELPGNYLYGSKNYELKLESESGISYYLYDFTDIDNKKIIEYHGDLFHANPKLFEANDNPMPYKKDLKSIDIWKKDQSKEKTAKINGYEYLVIWDSDFMNKEKKKEVIEKCINFLKN